MDDKIFLDEGVIFVSDEDGSAKEYAELNMRRIYDKYRAEYQREFLDRINVCIDYVEDTVKKQPNGYEALLLTEMFAMTVLRKAAVIYAPTVQLYKDETKFVSRVGVTMMTFMEEILRGFQKHMDHMERKYAKD